MRVQIATRRCDVPEPVRDRTDEQVRQLTKYHPRLAGAEVVFEEERHLKKVEGILSVDGASPVVATGQGEDFGRALDQMLDRLGRMLRRRRDQRTDHQATPRADADRLAAD